MNPIVNASLNLTKKCNLSCSYCFTGGKANEVISLDMAKKSIDFLLKNVLEAKIDDLPTKQKKIDISFWGGEPLLEWELLKKIVLYTESIKPDGVLISYGGTTNGTLLTPEKFDFLKEYNIYFMVSLDGTEETHDKHRKFCDGSGSQKIIIENLKEALKIWPFYKVRMSLYPERIDHFYEDIKTLIDIGVNNIYYSPVYEHEWITEDWGIWTEECFKTIDLIAEEQKLGREIKVEHFISYTKGSDKLQWPCGAGRGYVGIDTDGSIWPCHRFIKFNDSRPWQEKEMCFGHVEYGITKPEVRNKFIDFKANCNDSECYLKSCCHGGCYAVNFEHTGDIKTASKNICNYVKYQLIISNYYKEKVKIIEIGRNADSCTCYNMCYLEGTPEQIIEINSESGIECHCYNTSYSGEDTSKCATKLSKDRILENKKVTPRDVIDELKILGDKFDYLSTKIETLIQLLIDRK